MSLPKARDGFGEFFREKYANLPQKMPFPGHFSLEKMIDYKSSV